MKKHTLKEVVVLLGLLASTPLAFADHNPSHSQSTRESREDRESGLMTAWDTMGTPFRYAGRAGMSIVRTPVIIGETATGKRDFVTRHGLFLPREDARSSSAINSNEPELSVPTGRGNRIQVRTPQNE
jgi:hypothetical protein